MTAETSHPDLLPRIEAARGFLEANLDRDVPLDEVASVAKLSKFHFHRLFRGVTGETVAAYGRRLRLERAAHRLLHTERDILEIALDHGYGSHEAFTRAFASRFGMSPSRFRQERSSMTREPHPSGLPPIDLRIESRDACTVAAVRHVGPYDQVGDAWQTLMKWGWTKMMFGSPDTFGLAHDDPDHADPATLRYDACMIVKPGTRVKGDVRLQELPATTYAVAAHDGPYTGFGETYARLVTTVAAGPIEGISYGLGDPPALERYLNDPRKTKPEDLRSEIWFPVVR